MASLEAVTYFLQQRSDYCTSCLGVEGVAADMRLLMRYFSDEELPILAQWLEASSVDKPILEESLELRRREYASEFATVSMSVISELVKSIEEIDVILESRRMKKLQ